MSEHVAEAISDFLEGALDEERTRDFRYHLDGCAECAADVAWARDFQSRAMAQGIRHPSSARVLALASGTAASGEEDAHVAGCTRCQSELEWARKQEPLDAMLARIEPQVVRVVEAAPKRAPLIPEPVLDPLPESAPPPRREARVSSYVPAWMWAAGVVAVGVFALVMVLATRRAPPPAPAPEIVVATPPPVALSTLARVAPLPARFERGSEEPGSVEQFRGLGWQAYQSGDYQTAADHLRKALDMGPRNDEVRLYLGSAELLHGDAAAALPLLETVAVRAEGPEMRGEALWLLANAWLLLEERGGALETTRRLRELAGPHATEADSLEAEIERITAGR